MRSKRLPHPLEHHESFRAVIAAAPPVAELAHVAADTELVGQLAIACGDLASGFAAPPGSASLVRAHHRAWVTVRDLERAVRALRLNLRASVRALTLRL